MQFKGIARSLAHTPKRATPMCPPTLLYLSQFFDFSSSYESSMWAVMVVGFFMFSRISNLLPPKKGRFDRTKQLLKSDVKVSADSVIVLVKWSKVIQLSERLVTLPLKAIPGSPICPKTSLLNATRLAKSKDSDHLFSYRKKQSISTIIQSEFISFLRKKLKSAGLDPKLYSGHSLRRGGASWAFHSGVPSELIKHHGDWSSDSYLVYLEFSVGDKLKTTQFMSSVQ